MKTLLALVLSLPLAAQGWRVHDGWGLKQDKLLHAAAGAVVAGPVYAISRGLGASPKQAMICAALAALALGVAKEHYDARHGGWKDPADAGYTATGGFGFAFVVYRQDARKPEFATAPRLDP